MLIEKLAIAAAGMVVATVLGAPSFAHDAAGTRIYHFTFDGFCDGMNLTVSQKVDIVGQSTGCAAGGVDAGFTAKRGGIPFFDISSDNNGGGQALIYVFDDPKGGEGHGWCAYNTTDGVTENVINCGTYTLNGPAHRGPYPSSRYSR